MKAQGAGRLAALIMSCTALAGVAAIASAPMSATAQETQYRSTSTHDDRTLSVSIRGTVEFTEDERAVSRLSPGGRLQIEESFRGGRDRTVIVTTTREGTLNYAYIADGQSRPFDDGGRAWLAGILPEVVRETGIGAGQRVRRIHRQHGAAGVLDEIEQIRSGSSRRAHMLALMEMGPLGAGDATRALRAIGRISSSSERARVLTAALASFDLTQPGVRSAYFDAAGQITSSSELRRVLVAVLESDRVPQAAAQEAIATARRISSSAEKAAVLAAAAQRRPLSSEPLRDAFFAAAQTISSSAEHRRALVTLLRHQGDDPEVARGAVRCARFISSDAEKAAVLMEVPALQLRDSATVQSYRETMDTMSSTSARSRAAHRLAGTE